MDGENNSDALFIIKIDGVLDVIAHSRVILTNSTKASNVYWQINGALNVGDSVVFEGVVLSNGAINFAEGSVLNGNGLSRQGAISTINMTATIPSSFALPTKLIDFEGVNMETHNLLSWSTLGKSNNDYYTIERTTDGINFKELTRINESESSPFIHTYTYSDFDFEKIQNYYRLSQIDNNGETESLGLISINNIIPPKKIIHVVNMLGQKIDTNYTGLIIILFSNGEVLKFYGEYIP